MNIIVKLVFFILLTIISLNANPNFSKQEKLWMQNNPTVNIAMLNDFKPFSYIQNSTHQGFSVDLLDRISKISGLKFNKTTSPWTEALNSFKSKEVDMISGISYTKTRSSFTLFTEPFYEIPAYIFGLKTNNYKNNKSLIGKKVAITRNVFYKEKLKNLGINIVEYENSEAKAKAAEIGEVDYFLDSYLTGQQSLKNISSFNLKIFEEYSDIKKEDLRFGIQKNNPILLSIIKKSYESIPNSELINLSNKWTINTHEYKGSSLNLSSEQQHYLNKKAQITMCIDPNWMPFEKFDENRDHIGMSADYFKIFEKNIGIPIKVIDTKNWDESIEFAKSRKCDILSLAMETPKRKKYMNFTSPYLSIPLVVATLPSVTYIDNISILNEKKVGIIKGYAFNELIRNKYPNIEVVDVKNIDDGLQKVVNGELFGFIGTLASIGYRFQTKFVGELKITGKFDDKWELGIGVRNDDLVLLDIFEKAVTTLSSNDKQNILNKHISITYSKGINYDLIWKIIYGVLIFALIMFYFQKKLQQKVQEKTLELKKLNDSLEDKIKEEVHKNVEIQKQLFKSEKLASMGEMIGNIAHQWRQPLSAISTGASGMQVQKEYGLLTDELFNTTCESINNNAQYLSKTIDDFKNFIKGERIREEFLLEENINSFLSLVSSSAKSNNITVILDLEKDLTLNSYKNELTQCLMNIYNNAKDALNENSIKEKLIFISTHKTNSEVIIEIKDNANGIPKDILPKVFDPYFTTKHKSQGTGLGLHMTYNIIVDGMGGKIEVNNSSYTHNNIKYDGALFRITLPLE
ncbi:MAG: transporter substrate-binding domain-containing protein [Campylobacterota bacterium]|nr:transporter substrate-binding domain-containing protein [Campylobacterota bacterium]